MKKRILFLSLLAITLGACSESTTHESTEETTTEETTSGNVVTTESGLQIEILQEGDGIRPQVGQKVSVHYRGALEDGTEFDNSYDRGEPISFPIGKRQVIKGWEEGIAQLSKGAKAILTIPADLAYGEQGRPGIPGNSTLIFEVELVDIEAAPQPINHEPWSIEGVDLRTTNSGLEYHMVEEGTGAQAQAGSTVKVHYYGYLKSNGEKFDGSFERGEPIEFPLGSGMVIPGWEEGIALLKEGGKAVLVIPYHLAYGEDGRPPVIPAKADLVFDVELISVK